MFFLRRGNLRWRLTVWYGTAFAVLLLLHIGVATAVHYRQLWRQAYHAEIQDLKTAEGLLYLAPDGRLEMRENYFNHPETRFSLDRMLEVIAPDGAILYRNSKLNDARIGAAPLPGEGVQSYNEQNARLSDGRRVLTVSHVHWIDGRPVILRLAYDAGPLYSNVAKFLAVLLLLLPITVLVAGVVIYRVTGSALSPLSAMVRRAEQITAERLNERLPVRDPNDDLGHVAIVFNGLLQRLDDSFSQLKRFTSDASHELRTPLASLRSIGEVSLQSNKSDEEYRDVIASMLEEVARLTHLVDSLLVIARSDSGQVTPHIEAFSCIRLVREVVDLVGILAEDKGQGITIDGSEELHVSADRGMLRQAIVNVLENAIKYSPRNSTIRVDLKSNGAGAAEILIRDQGPGIPEEERTRIFHRFRRIDDGRSRERGGVGLGLSIAKWAVESNGGSIGVLPASGGGSCFYIRIPADVRTLSPSSAR